jgi:CelD/BcsL family acetyltransferase involved in cellulose biosynthesis/GNAT superfamily N-acetyltransferase
MVYCKAISIVVNLETGFFLDFQESKERYYQNNMDVCLVDKFEDINPRHWNDLVTRNSTNTIFQTYQWNRACWEAFRHNRRLYLICVRNGEDWVGIAPLMVELNDHKRVLKFISALHADYSDFIYEKGSQEVFVKILQFIICRSNDWDRTILTNIPEYSPTQGYIKKTNVNFVSRVSAVSSTLIFKKDLPKTQRILNKKSLKRHLAYFKRQEQYEVYHLTKKEDIYPHLEGFFQQHIERRKITGAPSLFLNEDNCNFYRNLIDLVDATNWVTFTLVKSHGKPIAYHYGFTYGDKFIWYKPSFDVSLFRHSPGEVLLKELLDYAFERNFTEFDFANGQEAFKERFANKIRTNYEIQIFKTGKDYRHHRYIHSQGPIKWARKLVGFAKKIIRILSRHGLFRGAKMISAIFWEKVFQFECVHVYNIVENEHSPMDIKADISPVYIRQVGVNDFSKFDHFHNINKHPEYWAEAFQRLKKGDVFLAAEHNETIVGFAWIMEGKSKYVFEVKTEIHFNKPIQLIYDCVIHPDYRKKKIFSFFLRHIIESNLNSEKIIYCRRNNIASRRAIEQQFSAVRKLYFLRISKMEFKWSQP